MSETPDEPVLLRIHLRGGQTIEKVVTDWSVKKSNVTGELLEFTWMGSDGERMPYLRADAVDAITRHPASEVSKARAEGAAEAMKWLLIYRQQAINGGHGPLAAEPDWIAEAGDSQ